MDAASIATGVVASSCIVHALVMGAFHVLHRRRRGGWAFCRREILRRPTPARPVDVGLVSILKPLAGVDDDLEANLESFAKLDRHPRHELLFGVASTSDPAARVARAFIARHPELDARLVITDPATAINPKVAQLIGLAAAARGDVLVTSDSNVRVRPDYLTHLLVPLGDPQCGLVTSLFAGTGERTLGAALENLQLAAMIAPSVVVSTLATPVTVGKSMAVRRVDFERLGGFAAFGDLLAEDAMMGRRFAAAGMRVATSFVAVENRNVVTSLSRTFERHARWAKMRRALAPSFFAFEPFFSPLIVALAAAVLVPSRATLALVAATTLLQTLTSFAAAWAVRGRPLPWRYLPLETVRVLVIFACWASAWMSRTVVWRGNALAVGRGTVLTPLPSTTQRRPARSMAGS